MLLLLFGIHFDSFRWEKKKKEVTISHSKGRVLHTKTERVGFLKNKQNILGVFKKLIGILGNYDGYFLLILF